MEWVCLSMAKQYHGKKDKRQHDSKHNRIRTHEARVHSEASLKN